MSDSSSKAITHSDYDEKVSVAAEHAPAARREKPDPEVGAEPFSLWAFLFCGLALIVGGGFYGANSGGFLNSSQFAESNYTPDPVPLGIGDGPKLSASEKWLKEGKKHFGAICAACHQQNGKGQQGVFPPLAGSEFVTGGTERLAMITLNGLKGPITVEGTTYNNVMQPWKASLNDTQLAQVLSYIRTSWGNDALLKEGDNGFVSAEMVAQARAEHGAKDQHMEAELEVFNKDLPGGPVDLETIGQ